jgi:hypothetical protein
VLAHGGAVLVCDNDAADGVADNLNPIGRMYYAVSTLVCTPNALSQHGPNSPEPLGTYAGAGRIAEIAHQAGFQPGTSAGRAGSDEPVPGPPAVVGSMMEPWSPRTV